MKRRSKKQRVNVVVVDWKSTDELIRDIARIIKRRTGLTIQMHDIGTDDWIVSIGPKRIGEKELLETMGWDDAYEVVDR